MNLAVWLERAARAEAHAPALGLGTGIARTYGDFARRAAGFATALTRMGLSKGARIAIAAPNSPEYLECLFGIWWAGCVAAPINAKLHASEVAWMLEHSGAELLIASKEFTGVTTAGNVVAVEDCEPHFREDAAPLQSCAASDLAWIFYTSGTTGRPKGAMLTHRNLAAMTYAALVGVDPTTSRDALLHAAPLSHGSGLYVLALVLQRGLNIVAESKSFDPDEIARIFKTRAGTSMFLAPTMLNRLAATAPDFPPDHIRTLVTGGGPLHVADAVKALDRFGPRIVQIYAQGETPMTGTVLTKADMADRAHPHWAARIASVGSANGAVEVRIGTHTEALPSGEIGEVLIRGDTVMAGYWKDNRATAATMKHGWLHTGDIGSIDAFGYLTLRDRSKDLIISGGSNIYPREVEEVLLTHPGITEASVIGRPDGEWGEVAVAYVVGQVDAAELDSFCLDRIARFKRPKDYVFVPELPKNHYGKVLKTTLRELDKPRWPVGATDILRG